MPKHRQGPSTHREAGIRDPEGGFPSPPAALRNICGGARIARLTDGLGKPS